MNFCDVFVWIFGTIFINLISTSNANLLNTIGELVPGIDHGPKCYGEYGCFLKSEISQDWHIPNFMGFYPESPQEQNPHFFIFSCSNRYNPTIFSYNATVNDIKKQKVNFDRTKRTIFLIHGYTDFYTQQNWMGNLKDHILTRVPCRHNVVVVDWSKGAKKTNYLAASANTRVVGAVVAAFIKRMNIAFNITNNNYTVMGHSLGGQTAGFVGKNLKNPQLALIIGLDPAGPAFSDVSVNNRLDAADAQLVVTIQTNGAESVTDGLGLNYGVGHYSFFPNGGHTQTGCDPVYGVTRILMSGIQEGLQDTFACSHRRAYELVTYEEFLFDEYESIGYSAENYDAFQKGNFSTCKDGDAECKPFGGWFDYWEQEKKPDDWQNSVNLYVDTQDRMPFSLFLYRMEIETGSDFQPGSMTIQLNVTGSFRVDYTDSFKLDYPDVRPNQNLTHLFKLKKSIGRIESISVRLLKTSVKEQHHLPESNKKVQLKIEKEGVDKNTSVTINIQRQRKWEGPHINVKEIRVDYLNGFLQRKRLALSSVLTPKNNEPVTLKSNTIFKACPISSELRNLQLLTSNRDRNIKHIRTHVRNRLNSQPTDGHAHNPNRYKTNKFRRLLRNIGNLIIHPWVLLKRFITAVAALVMYSR